MCDYTDPATLIEMPNWLQGVKDRADIREYVIMVLANNCEYDVDQSLVVELETKLRSSGAIFKEISVKNLYNIKDTMTELVDKLYDKRKIFIQQKLQYIVSH